MLLSNICLKAHNSVASRSSSFFYETFDSGESLVGIISCGFLSSSLLNIRNLYMGIRSFFAVGIHRRLHKQEYRSLNTDCKTD